MKQNASTLFLCCAIFSTINCTATFSAAQDGMDHLAQQFLESLNADDRENAMRPFPDQERFDWDYWPGKHPGIGIDALHPESKKRAIDLIKSGLSERGFTKTQIIKELDRFNPWASGGPYLIFFGKPDKESPWGWRLQGHHLSLNFTFSSNQGISGTPSFMGTQPLSHPKVRNGEEPLRQELGLAIELYRALDPTQQAQAQTHRPGFNYLPERIESAKPYALTGLLASKMTESQRGLLKSLTLEYINNLSPEIAKERRTAIESGELDDLRFAFAGKAEEGAAHYYRIQNSAFIIEYDCRDGGDHIHCIYREFGGDFGKDLLRLHYKSHPH